MGRWAGQVACWQDQHGRVLPSKAIFSYGGSLVLLALSSLPYPWSWLQQGQTAAWHFPESPLRTPFHRIVLRLLGMNRAILKARPSFPSSFSFPVESSSLSSRAALSTAPENSGLKLPSDIKMEGQSLIDDLAGWGPNSAEVLSRHPAAHSRYKSSLDQPFAASCVGWFIVQVPQYSTKRPALAKISHQNSRRPRLFDWLDWLLTACPRCCGMP